MHIIIKTNCWTAETKYGALHSIIRREREKRRGGEGERGKRKRRERGNVRNSIKRKKDKMKESKREGKIPSSPRHVILKGIKINYSK